MRLSKREACVLTAYTGKMFTSTFSDFHEFAEDIMGQGVPTHVFANENFIEALKLEVSEEARAIFLNIEYTE